MPDAVVAALDSARGRRPDLAAAVADLTLASSWVQAARQYLGQAGTAG